MLLALCGKTAGSSLWVSVLQMQPLALHYHPLYMCVCVYVCVRVPLCLSVACLYACVSCNIVLYACMSACILVLQRMRRRKTPMLLSA